MRPGSRFTGGACLAAAMGLTAAMLGGRPAWADVKASRACRATIAKDMSLLANTGFKGADACHKAADKASTASGACNDVSNSAFDPKGKYANTHDKATADIGKKCLAGDPVLSNYSNPPASGPDAVVGGLVDEDVGGNSTLVQGSEDLNGDKSKRKCLETIGKSRTAIIKEILKNSTKCQKDKDKTATTFDVIDPSCVDGGAKSTANANAKNPAACGSLDGAADLGSCSPLPQCVIEAAVGVGEEIAKALYKKVPPPSVCGNSIVEGDEQCDPPGPLCNAQCESLVQSCGPGTPAGGTISGHRVITVNLTVPPGSPLAAVRVGFDYPQLQVSLKGTGLSSVVQGAFQVLAPTPPDGFLSTGFDSDLDAGFVISSVDDFIATGPLVQVTLDQCTPLAMNICSRSQNVVGCCTMADVEACEQDPEDFTACQCGIKSGVTATDCANAPNGPCTVGACTSPPTSANTICSKKCTAGGYSKLNPSPAACTSNGNCDAAAHCGTPGTLTCTAGAYSKLNPSPAACTSNSNCDAPPHCDDPGTMTCTDGDPAKFGDACTAATEATDCGPTPAGACSSTCTDGDPAKFGAACTPDTQNTDCGPAPAGVCSSSTFCLNGDPSRIGLACSIKNDCGTPLDFSTCQSCPQLGDRTNATFGCLDISNPPVCAIGKFPTPNVGTCQSAGGPVDGCPSNNVCETQTELTAKSCTVTSPVNHLGQTIGGVTCSITVTEAP